MAGFCVRFAGPHLARGDDNLVPVKLRRGGRILGGSLSWDKPQQLAGFSREGPFNGMTVPTDVTVTRQVLAEPDSQLNDRTWATLADGTPLVTAERRGKGLIVLFHVTADSRWSDLPLSGSFVEMLRRLVALAGATVTADGDSAVAENAGGRAAQVCSPDARARRFRCLHYPAADRASHPEQSSPDAAAWIIHQASTAHRKALSRSIHWRLRTARLRWTFLTLNARLDVYRHGEPSTCAGRSSSPRLHCWSSTHWSWSCCLGGLSALRPRRRAAAAMLAAGLIGSLTLHDGVRAQSTPPQQTPPLTAQQQDFAMKATLQTHLAYVITGDAAVDEVSKAGLQGLTLFLAQRTALEASDPVGLDLARDELAFFPIIYWPISPNAHEAVAGRA